jgi:RNA polymerase sigma factor (sigma-70 family)
MAPRTPLPPRPPRPVRPEPSPRQKRVLTALPMVEQCAAELARTFYPKVKREDLLGAGTIGADKAAQKFDPEKHDNFPVFARHYIRGHMLNAIRSDFTSLRARVEHAMERVYDELACYPGAKIDLVGDADEVVDKTAREGVDDAVAASFLAAVLAAAGATTEEMALELEGQLTTLESLRKAIDALPPLEQEVIRLIYEKELEIEEIADRVCVCTRSVQRRHAGALRKLRESLEAWGVTDPRLIDPLLGRAR